MASKRKRNVHFECTGCSSGAYAEHLHPLLVVPICGSCHASVKARDVFIDEDEGDANEGSCVWCGRGDGSKLFMCDTCPKSFCTDCVTRNFGQQEAATVGPLEIWSCYLCCLSSLSSKLAELQVKSKNVIFRSLDQIYTSVRPPPRTPLLDEALVSRLSKEEQVFASIFSDQIRTSAVFAANIASYLSAADLYAVVYRLSSPLRQLFQSRPFFAPGLFQTADGLELCCSLFEHQKVSLEALHRMEGAASAFGSLRGGIFGDEPGLGKTVTVLSLILATAGQYPVQPAQFWDDAELEAAWARRASQHSKELLPVFNRLLAACPPGQLQPEQLLSLRVRCCTSGTPKPAALATLQQIRQEVRSAIRGLSSLSAQQRQTLRDVFSFEMNKVKRGLDPRERKVAQARSNRSRAAFERLLCPTGATLVIVPLALLEHWYEQIMRHVSLRYYSNSDDLRGLVYLDGLGDIVDIRAPIASMAPRSDSAIDCIEKVSSYLIVITTIERCAKDSIEAAKNYSKGADDFRWEDLGLSAASASALLQLRWLRLIVDEGHELTLTKAVVMEKDREETAAADQSAFHASQLISLIAAERRWIMSGTPTTGSDARSELQKLFDLLSFLRHPDFFNAANAGSCGGGTERALWTRTVLEPCVRQDPAAWAKVQQLVSGIMIRHTKADLKLFRPQHRNINLLHASLSEDMRLGAIQASMLSVDRSKAQHIAQTMLRAKEEWQQQQNQSHRDARRPKAIVFSQHDNDLQGVGHFLYSLLGDSNVCEHFGPYRSSELSRFRHSKRKFRACPLCGRENGIINERYCDETLYLVDYGQPLNNWGNIAHDAVPEPEPGGHGGAGPGGHYVGKCLCSPIGCADGVNCLGFPNPFYERSAPQSLINPNLAIVSGHHIQGWRPGVQLHAEQPVWIMHGPPRKLDSSGGHDLGPLLWGGGRMGGQAVIKQWRPCGGLHRGNGFSWHGKDVLSKVRWHVQEEDAMTLLLAKDGSTGLDLSFATHIFLLERIDDPALRNQIISRAHRVGAKGPVKVQLLQVIADSLPPPLSVNGGDQEHT